MPRIADIELTPNPNARKFILKEPLTVGVSRSFDSLEAATRDPLAAQLFAVPHVTNVYYIDRWLTVTQDGKADWQELLRDLAPPIREASAETVAPAAVREGPGNLDPETARRLVAINEILDARIRPALMMDGGGLEITGLEGQHLMIHYQGACGSCPSSLSGTLMAIESLLHSIEPGIQVVAV